MKRDLVGRRILITGASRGIGEMLTRRFAAAGAAVALVARSADTIAKLAADLGGTAHPADLGDSKQVATLINHIEDEAGPIDVLVNNAGIDIESAFWDQTADDLARFGSVDAVLADAAHRVVRAVTPELVQDGERTSIRYPDAGGKPTGRRLVLREGRWRPEE